MRYWLAGLSAALVCAAVAVYCCVAPHESIRTGMTGDEVSSKLGRPSGIDEGYGPGPIWCYWQTDIFGNEYMRRVHFDGEGRVLNFDAECKPFGTTPLWLDALRDAFRPRPVP